LYLHTGPEFEIVKTNVATADSTHAISELEQWNKMVEEAEKEAAKQEDSTIEERLAIGETYINSNGEETSATEPTKESVEEESKKKTYMIKDPAGQIQVKNKE
jgi:hypothetical protein